MFKRKKSIVTLTAAVALMSVGASAYAAPLDLKAPTDSGLPGAADVVGSAWSFASNFWEFFLIGIAAVVTPILFSIGRSALGRRKKA